MQNIRLLATAITTSMLLTACGGGGGGSSSSTSTSSHTTTTNTTTTVTSSASSTTPTSTASSSSGTSIPLTNSTIEANVVNVINQKRVQCGLSPLTLNAELNKAASNHANYMNYVTTQIQDAFASHQETVYTDSSGNVINSTIPANNPYFSGLDIVARVQTGTNIGQSAIAVNYPYSVLGEDIGSLQLDYASNSNTESTVAPTVLNGLFAAPYHLKSLLNPAVSEIGVKNSWASWTKNNYLYDADTLEVTTGLPSGETIPTNAKLINYPCAGITDTEYQLTDEAPNPIPGRDLKQNPIGQPIYILAPTGKVISTVDAHISTNGVEIATPIILTSATDPNKTTTDKLADNEAFVLPTSPLIPAQTYLVNYTVKYNDGTSDSNNFTFTTKTND